MICNFDKTFPKSEWGEQFIAALRPEAEKMVGTPIECLSFTEFMRFYETGSRVEYEQLYMEHRKRLYHMAAMALYEQDDKWVNELSDILSAICSEFVWTFPAHVDKKLTYKQMRSRIDLFAAETAQSLSEVLYLLSDRLPSHIVDMVKENLRERIVEPYFTVEQGWPKNNWQAVCHGCVAMCLMELDLSGEITLAKEKVVEGLNIFLDSYHEDGICLEGPLYWMYGFGYFVYAAAMLREYTRGEVDFFKNEKVKNIARFYEYAFVSSEYTVPFADSGHILYLHPGLIGFLHREYGMPLVPYKVAMKYGYDKRWRLADLIRDYFWSDGFAEGDTDPKEKFFEDSEWYYNKKEKYTLAAKGGHNDEPHNHNDLGSFVVFADGKYIVDDLGWPEYDKNYFNKAVRYENYICASSFGHSVPIIDGKGQLYGKDKRAKVISAENNEFYIDLSLAYGLNEGSVKRRVKAFCGEVLLTDYVKGDHDIISRIALRLEPKLLENGVKVGESLIIADVPCEIKISTKEFETRYSVAVSDTGRFVTAYFVDFIPKERTEEITLRIKI